MEINGYTVKDYKLVVGDGGVLINADRSCDCCLGSQAKALKVQLGRSWKLVGVCESCMIKEGLFLDYNDLKDEAFALSGGRSKG